MKGLGEKEGVSQNPENSHSSTSTTGNGGGVGEGSGGCGMWGAHPPPRHWPPLLSPKLPREAQEGGAGGWAQGRPPRTARLQRSLETVESKAPTHTSRVQMGRVRL